MPGRKSLPTPSPRPTAPAASPIPAELREEDAQHEAEQKALRDALLVRAEKGQRCANAAQAFLRARDALWAAPAEKARSFIPAVNTSLADACTAMAEAERLKAWGQTDHDATYASFRERNGRPTSSASYKLACIFFDKACECRLSEAELAEALDTGGLRHAIYWLGVFVAGLSGEGAPLCCKTPPAPSPAEAGSAASPGPDPGPTTDKTPADAPPPPRLTVDLARKTVTLDGTTYDLQSDLALRWVKVLADRPGEWVSSSELKRHDEELDGARPDRLKKRFLPPAIRSLIESDRRKGSRLRLSEKP